MKHLSFILFALLLFSQKTSAQSDTYGCTNCPLFLSEYVASYLFSPIEQAADVMALPSGGCAPLTIHFTVSDTTQVDEWHWLLPGATPAESFEMAPIVRYDTSGIYAVTLIITNALGSDTLQYPAFIEVQPELINPGFTVQVQGDSIITTNTTQGFTAYYWLLNGVAVDADSGPSHVFVVDSSGSYVVGLYVANACDTTVIQQSIIVTISSPDLCGCVNCPGVMADNFIGDFFYHVNNAANNDLASATQGVCGVRINFDHQYLGDLTMRIFSPGGQSVLLVGPIGFFGPTDGAVWDVTFSPCADTVFPDAGFNENWSNLEVWASDEVYSGSYYPADGCLEDFDTGSVTGVWRLEVTDDQAIDTGNLYDFEVIFCDIAGIACLPCAGSPTADFSVSTSGSTVSLSNISINAESYELSFGDGTTFSGNSIPTMHTYADTGTYLLHLIATNLCGKDTFQQIIQITGILPTANISPVSTTGCTPLSIHINLLDSDHVDQFIWVFPNGMPQISYEPEPTVVYNTPGIYPAFLVISNAAGADTLYYPNFVEVLPGLLTPGFTVQVQGDSIIATNTTQGFTEYYWLLNDVLINAGTIPQQIVQVDTPGIYTITLYVANECDTALIVQSVPVIFTDIKNADNDIFKLLLLPNPNDGHCRLELTSPENLPAEIVVLNTAGQNVFIEKSNLFSGKNARDLDLTRLPSGFYMLRLQTASGLRTVPFSLQH